MHPLLLGHCVSFLRPESIPEFLHDPIPQAFRGEHSHIGHPGQDPPHEFLASRCLHAHFDPTILAHAELLRRVPLALRDIDREFRLEQQPDLDGLLPTGNAEGIVRIRPGVEIDGKRETGAGGLDATEPDEWVIEPCYDDPFPDYDTEPVNLSSVALA